MLRPSSLPAIVASLATWVFVVLATCPAVSGEAEDKRSYELVLHGGRVIDPETGIDSVRDVGIPASRPSPNGRSAARSRSMRPPWWWRPASSTCTATPRLRSASATR